LASGLDYLPGNLSEKPKEHFAKFGKICFANRLIKAEKNRALLLSSFRSPKVLLSKT
jgi:hypothetical protein